MSRRRLLRWLGFGLLLLALAVAALLAWLLRSEGGRDWVLARAAAALPAGGQLQWTQAEGVLAGPLTLRGLQLTLPQQRDAACNPAPNRPCAMGQLKLAMEKLELDPALWPLLRRQLRLDTLAVRGLRLDLPRSEDAFELPRWPDVLPRLDLPLGLRVDALRLDDAVIAEEGAPLLAIDYARGGLLLAPGALHIEKLRIASDRGQFQLHGDYRPRDNYRSSLTASALLPAPLGQPAPRLGLALRGDLDDLALAVRGRASGPLRLDLRLRGPQAAPRWQLQAHADALDPGLLAGSGEPGTPLAFTLSADGTGGSAALQGRFRQDAFAVTLQPSQLRLHEQRLQLQPLVVDVLGGRVSARGQLDLGDDPARANVALALTARGLHWQGAEAVGSVVGDAELRLDGRLDAWTASGQARLARGKERATVDLAASGNRDGLRLDSLRAAMPQGRLDAHGTLAWAPALRWQAQAQLAGFDPGYFAPSWPGRLQGALQSHGQQRADGRLQAQFEAQKLGGQLRGRTLGGHARLAIDGDSYAGALALRLGDSRIEARGTRAATLELDADFAPLRLDDLLPGATGTLRGRLRLRGARTAPDIDVNLQGAALAYADYRIAQLQAKGRLPWRRGSGALAIRADGLQAGLPLTRLRADLRGALERLQLDAEAAGDAGSLALSASAQRQGARWQGSLESLALRPSKAAAWVLQQPAQWRWDGTRGSLSPACLSADGGGQLCASADWPRQGVQLDGSALPLALAADWLPERAPGQPWIFDGNADLHARLRPQGRGWQADARLTSASGGVRDRKHARRALLQYRDLQLEAELDPHQIRASLTAALDRDGRIDARIATGWDADAALDGALRASVRDLVWLELFSPDIVEPAGALDVDVQLGGRLGQPQLAGDGQLRDFAAELPALGIALQDGQLQLQALADGGARISGQFGSGQGPLQVEGSLNWRDAATPLQLTLRGNNVLLADTRQLRLLASPDLQLGYRAGAPMQLRGSLAIPSADIHLERLDMGVASSPDVVVLDPAQPQQQATPLALDMDLQLALGEQVRIDGYGLDGQLGGKLRLRQLPGRELRGVGALDVSGRYRAYGQDLRITRGLLLWSNAAIGDPILDIRAQREIGTVVAGVQVNGRASAPAASVWSEPAMSQSEALAYLTLGRPLPSLSSKEMQQVDVAKSALNAGVGLLASQLGTRIGLDEAGVSQSRALGGQVLGVGKYLSPKLYISYGVSLLGTGQVVTLKYLLRKGFDIQIESSTVENRASVNWRKEK